MRQVYALLPGLLAALAAGCAAPTAHTTGWWERMRPFQGPTGPDVVQMDVALLERPVGDPYVNHGLWASADEQVVALERKAVLEDNGLRVGQIGGITPAQLQALLTSDKSCANARQHHFRAGATKELDVGPKLPACRFQLRQDSHTLPVELEQAACTLQIQPSLTKDGRTRLLFTPVIRHGEPKLTFGPSADRARWDLLEQRTTETYTSLAWEVTLAPNEYVIIGARADRPHTLGQRFFVRDDEPVPVQRLLVIRTNRAPVADVGEEEEPPARKAPSLAAQAVWSAAGKR